MFEVLATANEEGRNAIVWPFQPRFHAIRSRTLALTAIMKVVYNVAKYFVLFMT